MSSWFHLSPGCSNKVRVLCHWHSKISNFRGRKLKVVTIQKSWSLAPKCKLFVFRSSLSWQFGGKVLWWNELSNFGYVCSLFVLNTVEFSNSGKVILRVIKWTQSRDLIGLLLWCIRWRGWVMRVNLNAPEDDQISHGSCVLPRMLWQSLHHLIQLSNLFWFQVTFHIWFISWQKAQSFRGNLVNIAS